jgi:hypothetical protein
MDLLSRACLRRSLRWDPCQLPKLRDDRLGDELGLFLGKVSACYRRLSRARGLRKAQTGAYTVIQRFSSSLALNIHFHSMVMDGVFVPAEDDGPPVFHRLAVKEDDDVRCQNTAEAISGAQRGLENRDFRDPAPKPAECYRFENRSLQRRVLPCGPTHAARFEHQNPVRYGRADRPDRPNADKP